MAPLPPILIVDDDPATCRLLAAAFADEGYTTATAGNGQEALDFLAAHPGRHLIILGLVMPVMDGWQFMRALEAVPEERRKHRIIILSGSVSRLEDHPLDVEATFAKPCDLFALMRTAATITEGWDAPAKPTWPGK